MAIAGVIIEMKLPGIYDRGLMILAVFFFFLITAFALIVFSLGQNKGEGKDSLYTLLAIGIKFIFSLLFALIWFGVLKESGRGSILLFFVLYLSATIFLIMKIVSEFKRRSIKNG
ncbi:MAG: hypothetical protein LC649_07665 [Bacteroidales bacterium]|nr:hypothetical protein [Bacteroidales bacterium]